MSKQFDGTILHFAIAKILLEKGKASTSQIMDELSLRYDLECDKKTVYSTVYALNRFVPIEVITGKNGGFIVRKQIQTEEEGVESTVFLTKKTAEKLLIPGDIVFIPVGKKLVKAVVEKILEDSLQTDQDELFYEEVGKIWFLTSRCAMEAMRGMRHG